MKFTKSKTCSAPSPHRLKQINSRNRHLRALISAFIGINFALAGTAWSQTPPDAGRLLEETKNFGRPVPLHTTPETPVVDAPVRPTIKMPEGLTVSVSGFHITGAVSFPENELLALVAPWVGKTLDLNELNEAAGAITRHYQSRGHILTYAYLPAQKIADGTIDIAVLEGRVENVQIVTAQDVRLQDEVVQAHVGDLAEAATVSQPEMERRLLLLNDIPGVVARAAFTPGSSTGMADMVVSVAEDDPLGTQIEFNNHGSISTGEYRFGVSFHFKDSFGVGDSTRARLIASQNGDMVNGSLSTKVPVGGQGWTLGGGVSRLTYQLGGSFAQLGGVGEATVFSLNTGYPIIRSFNRNLNFQASFDRKKLKDEIQLTATISPKDSNIFGIGLAYDQRDQWLGGGILTAGLNFYQGRLTLNNGVQQANDQAGLQTAGDFSKLNFDLFRQQALIGSWSLLGHLAGQQANKNLDSAEKFGLTGPTGVRAYAVGEASVDEGYYIGLEFRYSQPYVGGALVWSAFHDRGWGRINATPLNGVTGNDVSLYGSGIGLQWMGGDDIGVNTTLAWRGNRRPTAEGGDVNPRIYIQIYKNL